jgi:nitrogen regulatory protein PII
MKMLTIICRENFKEEVLDIFANQGITGYTVIPGAGGGGVTGIVPATHGWTDRNMLFLVALDNNQMATLMTAVKQLHAELVTENSGHEVALKMFLQPCEVIL